MLKVRNDNMRRQKTKLFLYVAGIAANIASLTCGIAFAWSSPELPRLNGQHDPEHNPLPYNISPGEASWIASLLHLGATFSPYISGLITDKIGRRKSLMLCMVPLLIAFIIKAFAKQVIYFYIARLLCGIGIGLEFTILPMYIGEIAQNWNRGFLGCLIGIFVTGGNLYTFCLGPFVTVKVFNLINIIHPVSLLLIAMFLPESAHYLVLKNKDEKEIVNALKPIRHEEYIEEEIAEIRKYIANTRNHQLSFMDVFKSAGFLKGLSITVSLVFFRQFSGINVVLSYMQSIFHESGSASTIPPHIAVILVGTIQVLACLIPPVVSDRWGRKCLLLVSTLGSSLTLLILGLYFYLQKNGYDVEEIHWVPVISLIAYIIIYNVGLGPLPISMIGEMFPSATKSIASSITISFAMFLGFLTTNFFLSLNMEKYTAFWGFSSITLCGFFYVLFFVYETKGKSFNDIQAFLSGKK